VKQRQELIEEYETVYKRLIPVDAKFERVTIFADDDVGGVVDPKAMVTWNVSYMLCKPLDEMEMFIEIMKQQLASGETIGITTASGSVVELEMAPTSMTSTIVPNTSEDVQAEEEDFFGNAPPPPTTTEKESHPDSTTTTTTTMTTTTTTTKNDDETEDETDKSTDTTTDKSMTTTTKKKKRTASSSIYLGVVRMRTVHGCKWRAKINIRGDGTKHIGNFDTEEEAARARDEAVRKYLGPGVRLNFPTQYDLDIGRKQAPRKRFIDEDGAVGDSAYGQAMKKRIATLGIKDVMESS